MAVGEELVVYDKLRRLKSFMESERLNLEKAKYLFFLRESETNQDQFDKILSLLNALPGVGIQKNESNHTRATIFFGDRPFRSELLLVTTTPPETEEIKSVPAGHLQMETEKADNLMINLVRKMASPTGYRFYSLELKSFLPNDVDLWDCQTGIIEDKVWSVLEKASLDPIFHFRNSQVSYARDRLTGAIRFINEDLLEYFVGTNQFENTPELSYKVSENLESFVALYDAGLIPQDFYRYFQKSFKIKNYSGFNLEDPGRKVFVKPFIFELNKIKQGFYALASEGSTLLYADKIRPGETLEVTLKRILRDDLKIAADFLGAVVLREVEFDRDKEGILTPRLLVRVFIEKAKMTPEQMKQKNQGWISLNQIKY